jgi:hypothetical protein
VPAPPCDLYVVVRLPRCVTFAAFDSFGIDVVVMSGAYKYPIDVQMDLVPLTPVGKVDRRALRKTAVWITIIPVARGLPQALAAVRDCASTAWFCV